MTDQDKQQHTLREAIREKLKEEQIVEPSMSLYWVFVGAIEACLTDPDILALVPLETLYKITAAPGTGGQKTIFDELTTLRKEHAALVEELAGWKRKGKCPNCGISSPADQMCGYCVDDLMKLKEEVQELRRDRERLDWLEITADLHWDKRDYASLFWDSPLLDGNDWTIRQAIDKAMTSQETEGKEK